MIQKKICMLGSFAVGKTSLVRRFVESIYSDAYHTTVGVKIDKKTVQQNGTEVSLLLWDLYGEDEFQKMRWSYLRGCLRLSFSLPTARAAILLKKPLLSNSVFVKKSAKFPLSFSSIKPTSFKSGNSTRLWKRS